MKIARIYIRVSTQEQAIEGFSIPAQKERLINYCKAKDYLVDDIYIDGGYSGSNLDRPGMNKLLLDIDNKKTDVIVVYKLDRLSRSQKDTLYLIEDVFLKKDIAFISMQESFDTSTAFGRAMVGILSVFAQLERENIRERSMLGKEERAKQGLWGGGIDPFGYDYKDDMLIPNSNSEIIKKTYELYLKGHGTPYIAKRFNNKYNRSLIRGWLMAPVYAGKIAHANEMYDGVHEPIIPWETFEEVQEVMKTRSNKKGKAPTVNMFAGIVKCKQCGASYGSRKARDYHYLSCYSRTGYIHEMIKDENCKNANWRLDKIEEIVEEDLFKIINDDDYYNEYLNKDDKEIFNYDLINRQIKELDKKINKIVTLMLDEDLQIDVMKEKLLKLNEEKKVLIKLKEDNNEKEEEFNLAKKTLTTIKGSWDNLSIKDKNEMLRRVIKVIWIDEVTLEIVYNF